MSLWYFGPPWYFEMGFDVTMNFLGVKFFMCQDFVQPMMSSCFLTDFCKGYSSLRYISLLIKFQVNYLDVKFFFLWILHSHQKELSRHYLHIFSSTSSFVINFLTSQGFFWLEMILKFFSNGFFQAWEDKGVDFFGHIFLSWVQQGFLSSWTFQDYSLVFFHI